MSLRQPPPEPAPDLTAKASTTGTSRAVTGTWMAYAVTLPERVVRSVSAVAAGLLREIGDVALPASVRRTRLYNNLVTSTLRFVIEQVGQVEGTFEPDNKMTANYMLRRAAGNGIEVLGVLAFRASPVWVMAALADLSGSGRHLLRQIVDELKSEGLLAPDRQFASVDQILDGLEETSGRLAETVNTPPLDVEGLRREWQDLKRSMKRIPPDNLPSARRLLDQWRDLRDTAHAQGRNISEVSTALALSAIAQVPARFLWLSRSAVRAARRTGQVLAVPLLDHYGTTLATIRETGFGTFWAGQFRPYLKAAAAQFARERPTLTQRWVAAARRPRNAPPAAGAGRGPAVSSEPDVSEPPTER